MEQSVKQFRKECLEKVYECLPKKERKHFVEIKRMANAMELNNSLRFLNTIFGTIAMDVEVKFILDEFKKNPIENDPKPRVADLDIKEKVDDPEIDPNYQPFPEV